MRPQLANLSKKRWLQVRIVGITVFIILTIIFLLMGSWESPTAAPRRVTYGWNLVQTLSKESTAESIDNLPQYDDRPWLLFVTSDVVIRCPETCQYHIQVFPRLNRVRKILQEGRGSRDQVVAALKDKLARSCVGYSNAYARHMQLLNRATRGLVLEAPDQCDRAWVYAAAATYLLQEMNAFDSLALMMRIYDTEGPVPVNRLFLGYSMHLLASRHPVPGLSQEAREALKEYLEAAKDVPPAQSVEVPAWNANVTEADFRHIILREDIGLQHESMVRLTLYPASLCNYEDVWDGMRSLANIEDLVSKMRKFVSLAYPGP